ncbi:hypothetical protein FNF27_02669 [Cafeteria roenbergensis]|uniref:TmcB/TmcC TPR repeats domain-containing protein n=1 Tax=Cafeteria roenbergensis TaxID=33653 RepID=A0A5A8EFA8_CAFRO|nr:hypothetical protein FNF27_02669 [Cafeteria roenbergensis]
MQDPTAAQGGIDAALLAARRAWFGVLFLLSRESKASTAGFVVTTVADLIQFSVFPMMTAVALGNASTFQSVATVLSVAILDVDTLFALADVGSGAGRAVVFWAALAIVAAFLGLLGYVIATILTEGRQQAIVLRALGNMASVLTTVAFMPASSLLLAVFHECRSVNALGVTCNTDGHWIVIALVVIVLTVFTAVSTFFASVYIDTDLTSTALGAKVTGRVDAVMLVAKLVLVACFTTMDLPPSLQVILAGVAALLWLLGTLFAQPHVQPLANNLATAAAALNAWLVLAVATQLVAPEAGIDALLVVGMVVAPMLGYFANVTYVGAVAGSDFASLRSSLQADIWARRRVALAQRLQANSQHSGAGRHGAARAGSQGGAAVSKRPGRRDSPVRGQSYGRTASQAGAPARGELPMSARGGVRVGRTGKPVGHAASLASLLGDRPGSVDGGELVVAGPRAPMRIQVFADNGPEAGRESAAEPATTGDLLPGVTSEALIEQASMAYDEMLKAWPKSAVTYASGSIFHRAYGSTVSSELTILAMARKQVGSAWDVSFLSYQRTRQLQERSASGLSAVDRILFDEAWTTAIEETTKAFAAQNKLYNHAVESNPDANRLGLLAEELFLARSAAERKFRTMLQINPDSTMALRAFSRFCEDVLGDSERATELQNKANRIEEKHAKTNVRPLENVVVGSPEEPLSVMDEMNAVITMTGELRRYGEITDANVATARLFGRGRSDLVGQSLASLFPEPLGSMYDAAILAYLSPHEKGEAFARGAHVSVVQTAGGWLSPVRVSLQESAGSELDATPCLSMVVQRAPTKRRLMVVGDADSGFPVLALDAESMALLGDDAGHDDGLGGYDDCGDDVNSDCASVGGEGGALIGGRGPGEGLANWGQTGAHPLGISAGGGMSGHEPPLLKWLPDLSRLAAAAVGSASGAQGELVAVGTMYNPDEFDQEYGVPLVPPANPAEPAAAAGSFDVTSGPTAMIPPEDPEAALGRLASLGNATAHSRDARTYSKADESVSVHPDESVGLPTESGGLFAGSIDQQRAPSPLKADQYTVGGGNDGSVTSALGSASRITKLVVDTALSKSDPMVWRVGAVVFGSLVAVITFAVVLAIVLPASNYQARLLVHANDLAQRRLYHSDSASNAWYQLISVSYGFTAVNNWDMLTTNLTQSINRMEAAHRELLAISQKVKGELFQFELERVWKVCTDSPELYICTKYEMMSASDLVEFSIYQLRQMAAEAPADIQQSSSFLTNVPNIDLMALALHRAEQTSARELARGMDDRLTTMSTALVTAALLTFVLATLGTTVLMAAIGRHRFSVLASIPQVPRKQLRELARQSEESQLAFVRAVGADTGEEGEGAVADIPDEEVATGVMQSRRDLTVGVAGNRSRSASGQRADGGEITGTQSQHRVAMRPANAASSTARSAPSSASKSRGCCRRSKHHKGRHVSDSSWFVWKASLKITSPLTLIGGWIAVVLVMVSSMYRSITVDAARSSLLHSYAAGASALRGQLELVLLISGPRRADAMTEAKTNSTKVLQSLGGVLNGAERTSFGVELPGLAATEDPTTSFLFDILVHDSCLVLPHGSFYWQECRAVHDEFGLRGLHSFTTAMLDDGVQARGIFDENDPTDTRTLPDLIAEGVLPEIIPPLQRYDLKSSKSEIIIRHLVNVTADAAVRRFDETWADVQIVLGAFSGFFVLIVWLWALPSVRKLEQIRRAHFTVLLSLPDDVITGTPAITKVLTKLATGTGLTQAARALSSLAKSAVEQAKRQYRISSTAPASQRRVHPSSTAMAATKEAAEDGASVSRARQLSATDRTFLLSPVAAGTPRAAGGSDGDGPPVGDGQSEPQSPTA